MKPRSYGEQTHVQKISKRRDYAEYTESNNREKIKRNTIVNAYLLTMFVITVAGLAAILFVSQLEDTNFNDNGSDDGRYDDRGAITGGGIPATNLYGPVVSGPNGQYRLAYSAISGTSIKVIGWDANYAAPSGSVSIVAPDGYTVTGIGSTDHGQWVFDCSGITSVTIPSSVTYIGDAAFANCTSLASITIPSSVTHIGDQAFQNCASLTSVTIPNSVTAIHISAFFGCTGLTSITIPSSVTYIGDAAFANCTSLTSVFLEGTSLPPIVTSTFNNSACFYSHGTKDSSWWGFVIPDGCRGAYYDVTLTKASGETVFKGMNAVHVPSSTNNYQTAVPVTQALINQYVTVAGSPLYYSVNGGSAWNTLLNKVLTSDLTGIGKTVNSFSADV